MIGGAKGIGIGIDFGIPNQYCRATSKPYIEKDVLDSLRVVASAYGKSNDDADRSIVKNLVDASNPFIISNAAYEGMSGYNGYPVVFGEHKTWEAQGTKDGDKYYIYTSSANKFDITQIKISSALFYTYIKRNGELTSGNKDISSFKLKVTGLDYDKFYLSYYYLKSADVEVKNVINITSDGIYELPKSFASDGSLTETNSYIGLNFIRKSMEIPDVVGNVNVTIEILPNYEGALCFDGVDDMITSTKTVQDMLGGSNEITVVSMIHQIADRGSTYPNIYNNQIRYSTRLLRSTVTAANVVGKTGIYGYTATGVSITGTPTGKVVNDILGDKNDYPYLASAFTGIDAESHFSVEGYLSDSGNIIETSKVAWYWTIIANKVLTTDQINQVIAYFNLDRTLKSDIYCNIAKQGITNENHAEFGDKLIDFSGNGRDIQLNNIAWDGDSGIGKYNYPNWKVTATIANTYSTIVNYPTVNGTYSINVNGVSELMQSIGLHLEIKYTTSTGIIYNDIKQDGVYSYILPDGATDLTLRFGGIPGIVNEPCNITITQIPSHAGALCLDGVNDFGQFVGDLELKDYTFIADRAYSRIAPSQVPFIASTQTNGQAPFLMEYLNEDTYVYPHSFGTTTKTINLNIQRQISYQSTYVYNGNSISKGISVDTGDGLTIGNSGSTGAQYSPLCLWSLMLFPYSMSEFLIERQLKKYKLGSLYPNMVEFRPVIKSNASYDNIVFYYKNEKVENGTYLTVGSSIGMHIRLSSNSVNEIKSITINGIPATFKFHDANNNIYQYDFNLTSKSPQKINITIDEYIRYEDIVQPYPLFFEFTDENGNLISWGGKAKVGSTITRTKGVNYANLLEGLFTITNPRLNGVPLSSSQHVVEKSMVFTCTATWAFDNNEPKSILSPRLLSIPNSSYKILGYIPDISGHNNHGVIHNSAYVEGSGVNEDGSYQFDGVDDFVSIPTLSIGGKQVLMKTNWLKSPALLYDQRASGGFAILTTNEDDATNPRIAYQARNQDGKTYIDGIENNYIETYSLKGIVHNITVTNPSAGSGVVPVIGANTGKSNSFAKMALYDFMLFDEISTDDKIKELNEYVGIEGNVWRILTQLSNSTLISNETLIKNE